MNIKQKIYSLPAIALVISASSIATNLVLSESASNALTHAGKVHYPALS